MTGMDARFLPAAGGTDRVATRRVGCAVDALAAPRDRAVFAAFTGGRRRAVAREAAARGTGFRDFFAAFFAVFFAARRLGAVFRAAVFRATTRLRPAVLRPPLVFLPACRPAFRLAIGRPFTRSKKGPAYLDSNR